MIIINPNEEDLTVPIKIFTDTIPDNALQQLKECAKLPFIVDHIAVMPDVHMGKGATIGSVVPTKGAIVPSIVGVDIGCGMSAVKTNIMTDEVDTDILISIQNEILKRVPVGCSQRKEDHRFSNRYIDGPWREYYDEGINDLLSRNPEMLDKMNMDWRKQMGTLGGGNHFIELSTDEDNYVWVVIHTGSRGVGNTIANYFINIAKTLCSRWFIKLPNPDLAFLPDGSIENYDYLKAMGWCQEYAKNNRDIIVYEVIEALEDICSKKIEKLEKIDCHHNYISKEKIGNNSSDSVYVTRKGAINIKPDTFGIIPGSMGTPTYIVTAKCIHKDSFCSASHGAGRLFSRNEATKTISQDDYENAMNGIVCMHGKKYLDESPQAYKNIDEIMNYQKDWVEIVHTLHPIMNVKG